MMHERLLTKKEVEIIFNRGLYSKINTFREGLTRCYCSEHEYKKYVIPEIALIRKELENALHQLSCAKASAPKINVYSSLF